MAGNRDRGKMKGAMARGWGAVASNRDRDSDQKQRQWPETGIRARNRDSGHAETGTVARHRDIGQKQG